MVNFNIFKKSQSATQKSKRKRDITFSDVQQYFDLSIKEAAHELSISLTQLKRVCRKLDIPKWPHRKLQSLQNKVDDLKGSLADADDLSRTRIRNKINSHLSEMQFIRSFPRSIANKGTSSANKGPVAEEGQPRRQSYGGMDSLFFNVDPGHNVNSVSVNGGGSSSNGGSPSPRFPTNRRRNSITKTYQSKQRWSLPSSLDALESSNRRWSVNSSDSTISNNGSEMWSSESLSMLQPVMAEEMELRDRLRHISINHSQKQQGNPQPGSGNGNDGSAPAHTHQHSISQPLESPVLSTADAIKCNKRRSSLTAYTLKDYHDTTLSPQEMPQYPPIHLVQYHQHHYPLPPIRQQPIRPGYRYSSGENLVYQAHNNNFMLQHSQPQPLANQLPAYHISPAGSSPTGSLSPSGSLQTRKKTPSGSSLEQFSLSSTNFTNLPSYAMGPHRPMFASKPEIGLSSPRNGQNAEDGDVRMQDNSPLPSPPAMGMRQNSIQLSSPTQPQQPQQQQSSPQGTHPPVMTAFVPLNDQFPTHRPQVNRRYSLGSLPSSTFRSEAHGQKNTLPSISTLPVSPGSPESQTAPGHKTMSFVEKLFMKRVPGVIVKKKREASEKEK